MEEESCQGVDIGNIEGQCQARVAMRTGRMLASKQFSCSPVRTLTITSASTQRMKKPKQASAETDLQSTTWHCFYQLDSQLQLGVMLCKNASLQFSFKFTMTLRGSPIIMPIFNAKDGGMEKSKLPMVTTTTQMLLYLQWVMS